MPLPELDWNDPLLAIHEFAKNRIDANAMNEFEAAFDRYTQKLLHVSFIWGRLRADTDGHERYVEFVASTAKVKTALDPLTTEESRVLGQLTNASKMLHLDYEDFLIHSKILMDRVIFLTNFVMRGMKNRPPTTSFTKHRKFFLGAASVGFQDKEYANYIRENTQWFETLLKSYRDQFVVHDMRFKSYAVVSGPNHPPRLWRTRDVDTREWEENWQSLLALRDKYLNSIPTLATVSLNLYELIDFLDSHSSTIDLSDLDTLAEIRRFSGGKLPDLVELANHIQQFLLFFGTHFRDRMMSKP